MRHRRKVSGRSTHTLSSSGTVVPPLLQAHVEVRYEVQRDDTLTVTRTTLRPARACCSTNDRTFCTSPSRPGGGGWVAKYDSAENGASADELSPAIFLGLAMAVVVGFRGRGWVRAGAKWTDARRSCHDRPAESSHLISHLDDLRRNHPPPK